MLQPSPKLLAPVRKRNAPVSGREAKHSALLDEAAQEFNAHGISGASVARIARRMRLTRAAVYYYFDDRDDLAEQCYRRTCELTANDLRVAEHVAGNGLDRVLAFLRQALDPQRLPSAALSEPDYLKGRAYAAISLAHGHNVDRLRSLVRAGVADGSIRACDDEIIAQTLIGTITWIPLSVGWVEGTDETFRARTVEALCELIVNGHAVNRQFVFTSPAKIEAFFPPSVNPFDRPAAAAAKIEQLLMTASEMFNRRGADGTLLDEITNALGATKGALYHYLENKTDLVIRCHRRAFRLYENFADAADEHGHSGLERSLIGLYLNTQAHTSGLSPLIQMSGVSALPLAVRREITRRARGLQRRFEGFGKQGLADGSFRGADFDAVSQLSAGAFQWLPKWFRLDDPRAPHALAEEIVTLFIKGLRAS